MVLDGLNRKRASAGRDANADSVGMNPGNENTTAAFPSHQGNETAAVQKGTGLEGKAPAVENENGEAGGTGGAGQASWKIDPKLENDLVKLFGQANQVDGAFKVGGQGILNVYVRVSEESEGALSKKRVALGN